MHVIGIGNNTVNLQIMHSERCGSFIVNAHVICVKGTSILRFVFAC